MALNHSRLWWFAACFRKPAARDHKPSSQVHIAWRTVIGTPAYMSPEQARGLAVGKASDVFSLGATLYAILTGTAPYSADSLLQIIEEARNGNAADLQTKAAGMPRPLIAIYRRAMAVDPAERYQSATELAEDIDRHLAGEVVSAYRKTRPNGCSDG